MKLEPCVLEGVHTQLASVKPTPRRAASEGGGRVQQVGGSDITPALSTFSSSTPERRTTTTGTAGYHH